MSLHLICRWQAWKRKRIIWQAWRHNIWKEKRQRHEIITTIVKYPLSPPLTQTNRHRQLHHGLVLDIWDRMCTHVWGWEEYGGEEGTGGGGRQDKFCDWLLPFFGKGRWRRQWARNKDWAGDSGVTGKHPSFLYLSPAFPLLSYCACVALPHGLVPFCFPFPDPFHYLLLYCSLVWVLPL